MSEIIFLTSNPSDDLRPYRWAHVFFPTGKVDGHDLRLLEKQALFPKTCPVEVLTNLAYYVLKDDEARAIDLLKTAAMRGSIVAEHNLIVHLYRKLQDPLYIEAMKNLARRDTSGMASYSYSDMVPPGNTTTDEFQEDALKKGFLPALFHHHYDNVRKCAEAGYYIAQLHIAQSAFSAAEKSDQLKRAALERGYPPALWQLALECLSRKEVNEAWRYGQEALQKGYNYFMDELEFNWHNDILLWLSYFPDSTNATNCYLYSRDNLSAAVLTAFFHSYGARLKLLSLLWPLFPDMKINACFLESLIMQELSWCRETISGCSKRLLYLHLTNTLLTAPLDIELPALTHLSIQCNDTGTAYYPSIVQCAPNLIWLRLRGRSQLSECLYYCPHLESLIVTCCIDGLSRPPFLPRLKSIAFSMSYGIYLLDHLQSTMLDLQWDPVYIESAEYNEKLVSLIRKNAVHSLHCPALLDTSGVIRAAVQSRQLSHLHLRGLDNDEIKSLFTQLTQEQSHLQTLHLTLKPEQADAFVHFIKADQLPRHLRTLSYVFQPTVSQDVHANIVMALHYNHTLTDIGEACPIPEAFHILTPNRLRYIAHVIAWMRLSVAVRFWKSNLLSVFRDSIITILSTSILPLLGYKPGTFPLAAALERIHLF